ncbi:hypothetical protein HMPREF3207_04709 [Citrobacter koseri]|nr:hypothetical protein HMPREF3207_04709 [Citrobacter koseri]
MHFIFRNLCLYRQFLGRSPVARGFAQMRKQSEKIKNKSA